MRFSISLLAAVAALTVCAIAPATAEQVQPPPHVVSPPHVAPPTRIAPPPRMVAPPHIQVPVVRLSLPNRQVAVVREEEEEVVEVSQRGRRHQGDNYAEVRKYLKNYKGPLWQTRGPIGNRYMNKQAPESAVPCKPPGYDHVVLCDPY